MLNLSPRQKRATLWIMLAVTVGSLLWMARPALIPYLLGMVLAYLLLPLVHWLDRHMPRRLQDWKLARPLSILLTYLLLLILVAGVVAFFVPLVIDQVQVLIENWPELSRRFEDWGAQGLTWYHEVPDSWQDTIEKNVKDLVGQTTGALREGLAATVRTVSSTISFIIGFVVIPFWLFYILHDESQVKTGIMQTLPQQIRSDVQCVAHLLDAILSAYIRGQLLLCLFVGGMATISLSIIGVPFALVLGLIAGVFEILPYIGPILGAIPALVVALLSEPISAIWVGLAFFLIQQVENLVLVPRISGESVKLHPALVMVVLVMGNELAGVWGMLIAVPVTAILRDAFKYLYLRLQDEPLEPEEAMKDIRSGTEVQLRV